jgi:hypothetical protein
MLGDLRHPIKLLLAQRTSMGRPKPVLGHQQRQNDACARRPSHPERFAPTLRRRPDPSPARNSIALCPPNWPCRSSPLHCRGRELPAATVACVVQFAPLCGAREAHAQAVRCKFAIHSHCVLLLVLMRLATQPSASRPQSAADICAPRRCHLYTDWARNCPREGCCGLPSMRPTTSGGPRFTKH